MKGRIERELRGIGQNPITTTFGFAILVIVAVVLFQNPKLVTDTKTLLALALGLKSLLSADATAPEDDPIETHAIGFPIPTDNDND